MPPKKKPTKSQPSQAERRDDKDVSDASKQGVCDGCLDIVAEKDALKCSSCNVWLHCYCAGIPRSHFERIASSFVCAACSLTASRTVATEMKNEISALKVEIQELKAALVQEKQVSQSMANEVIELRSCLTVVGTGTVAPTERSYAAVAGRKPREFRRVTRTQKRAQQRSPTVSSEGGIGSESTTTSTPSGGDHLAATTAQASPREPVRGARRVWGTLPLITCKTVRNTISRLTQLSCMNEIQVRRKFIRGQSTRSGKDKWWFVMHGDEDSLQSLETAWETVKLQTGWQLEQCTKPVDAGPASAAIPPPQPPPTAAKHQSENSSDDHKVTNDTRALTNTDSTIPNHSQASAATTTHSQASTNSFPSPDQNHSSSSHSFLETTQVTHAPPLLN